MAVDHKNKHLFKQGLKCLMALVLVAVIFWAGAGNGWAHSTEGRVRVVLDRAKPTYDDFAYFIEPYVNQEKYKGVHQPYMGRFYAMDDVMELRIQGREAVATFEVLDLRGNKRFMEKMRFIRGEDGVWRYPEAAGGPREVFTYIPEWQHFLQTKVKVAAMVGVPLLLGLLFVLRRRRIGKQPVSG